MSSVRNELALANAQELINVRRTSQPNLVYRGQPNVAFRSTSHRKQTTSATPSV